MTDSSASSLPEASRHGQWSTRMAFILAATGSAVGLGNIWKFPYITGENGGGAFVLIYLLCIALIGIPLMMAEVMVGRRGRQNPVHTMQRLAEESGHSRSWGLLGWMGVIAGFLILSYYSVIAGWAMAYVPRIAGGVFDGMQAAGVESIFTNLVSDPERLLAWHTLFMVLTMIVVSRGVSAGLEKAVRFLMPILFVLLIVLVVYAYRTTDFQAGLDFLFTPDFSKLTTAGVLTAMGHAFFTLSLGMGAIMIYGSYLPANTSIASTSVTIAIMDTVVALMAGMAIYPIVFANGLDAAAGPGLIFQTLPLAFGQMPMGDLFGTLFFVLLVFAAWTSAISLIEPAVTWMMDSYDLKRTVVAVWAGIAVWLMGIATILSFNLWSDQFILNISIATSEGEFAILKDATIFDSLDYLTSNIMLPVGGLLIAVFAGWLMKKEFTTHELALKEQHFKLWRLIASWVPDSVWQLVAKLPGNFLNVIFINTVASPFVLWAFLVKWIAPLAVIIVFLNTVGVLKFVLGPLGIEL